MITTFGKDDSYIYDDDFTPVRGKRREVGLYEDYNNLEDEELFRQEDEFKD